MKANNVIDFSYHLEVKNWNNMIDRIREILLESELPADKYDVWEILLLVLHCRKQKDDNIEALERLENLLPEEVAFDMLSDPRIKKAVNLILEEEAEYGL